MQSCAQQSSVWVGQRIFGLIRALDDLGFKDGAGRALSLCGIPALDSASAKSFFKKGYLQTWWQANDAAVAVLDVGTVNDRVEQQTQRIYENMALLALDSSCPHHSRRIDPGPPFLRFSRFGCR